jgi:predicted aminopeptidase
MPALTSAVASFTRRYATLPMRAKLLAGGAALAALLVLPGCAQLGYYAQAAQGQYALWSGARPIDQWLGDPATDAKLKTRLAKARQIRQFAVKELGLPDNGSYKNYAALQRPFVLWNVVATPELSLTPLQWCFPIAGCVNYRGYYSKSAANDYAATLRADGDDVQIGGVPAYSTLGWFDDPLLSTFINYNDAELARMIFHELAHQVVYIAGDSRFNESFAVSVEEAGVRRWMEQNGSEATRTGYALYSQRRQAFLALLLKHRDALATLYASDVPDAAKRRGKARAFAALQDDYVQLKISWGGYAGYDRLFADPLSNAHLAAIATYNDYLPGFRTLLAASRTFPQYYTAVRALSERDQDVRDQILSRLGAP